MFRKKSITLVVWWILPLRSWWIHSLRPTLPSSWLENLRYYLLLRSFQLLIYFLKAWLDIKFVFRKKIRNWPGVETMRYATLHIKHINLIFNWKKIVLILFHYFFKEKNKLLLEVKPKRKVLIIFVSSKVKYKDLLLWKQYLNTKQSSVSYSSWAFQAKNLFFLLVI